MPDLNAAATASADLYGSGKSDLEILNDDSFLSADAGATADADDADAQGAGGGAATDGASSTDGGAAPAAGTVDVTPPEWLGASPQEMQDLWGRKDLAAPVREFIKSQYEELQSLKSGVLGTAEAVTEVNELFPGGVEDMRSAVENAQVFVREREQFASGDPTQQSEFLGTMLQENPDAYVSALHVVTITQRCASRLCARRWKKPRTGSTARSWTLSLAWSISTTRWTRIQNRLRHWRQSWPVPRSAWASGGAIARKN